MEEIAELNRFVKAALESGGTFAFKPHRRHFRKWTAPTLLAASVACVLAIRPLVERPAATETDTVAGLITLLSSSEALDVGETSPESTAELLLAWQDAPCIAVLSDTSSPD